MSILNQFKKLFWPTATESNYQIKRVSGIVVLLVALYLTIKIIGG